MGIVLSKRYLSYISNQNVYINLENYIQNKGDKTNILKLINPTINLLISKIEKKNTTLEFFFIDYQINNYYDIIELFNEQYQIVNNKLEINFNNLNNNNYNDDCFLTTELIIKNENERKNFLITIYFNKKNIYNVLINNKSTDNYNLEIIFYGKNKKDFQKNLIKINYRDEKNKKILITINNYEEIDSYENFKKLNNIDDAFFEKIKHKGNKIKKTDFPIRRRYNIINIISENFYDISKYKYEKNDISAYHSYTLVKFIDINKGNKYLFKIEKTKELIKLDYEIEKFLLNFYDIYIKFDPVKDEANTFYEDCQKFILEFEEKKEKLNAYFLFQKCKNTYYNEIAYLKSKLKEQEFENKFISYCILLIVFSCENTKFINFMSEFNNIVNRIKTYSLLDRIKIILTQTLIFYNTNNFGIQYNLDKFENKLLFFKSEKFFRDIIKNLEEYSALFFIYLQLNSGSGENLYNGQSYYKVSMLELIDIKFHLLKLYPTYFFVVTNEHLYDIVFTCYPTTIETFNITNLFKSKILNKQDIEDSTMSLSLIKFHESGHEKFSFTSNGSNSPRNFFTPKFLPIEQTTWEEDREKYLKKFNIKYNIPMEDKNNFYIFKGESGKCVDFYLFKNYAFISNLIYCDNLKEIKNLQLFISPSLNELHDKILEILKNSNDNNVEKTENIQIGINQLRNTRYNFKIDVFEVLRNSSYENYKKIMKIIEPKPAKIEEKEEYKPIKPLSPKKRLRDINSIFIP